MFCELLLVSCFVSHTRPGPDGGVYSVPRPPSWLSLLLKRRRKW